MRKNAIFVVATVVLLAAVHLTSVVTAQRNDLIEEDRPDFFFGLQIEGVDAGNFAAIDGLSIEQEVVQVLAETDPLIRKRRGRVKYGDITLKRRFVSDSILNDWIEAARLGDTSSKEVAVQLVDARTNESVKKWNCFECFPKSWKVSSLDGKGNDVLVEEFVMAIQWWTEDD